jgi:hypothetical protein
MTDLRNDAPDAVELRRLRERVAQLEAELAVPAAAPPTEHHQRWRAWVSATLIVVACVLAPIAVTTVWANRQISDTDRYVETVAPLAEDPAVQAAVAKQVTDEVLTQLDVPALTSDVVDGLTRQRDLSPRAEAGLRALRVPLTNGIEGFVASSVDKVVASDQFSQAWVEANRTAHTAVVKLLSGEQGGAVSAQGNEITINLGPIVAEVKQRLVDSGYGVADKIPTVDRSFVLVTSDGVTKAQRFYDVLNTLGYWLPIVSLLLLGLGVYAARGRRRALIAGSLGLVAGMVVLGVGLAVARLFYLNSVPPDVLPTDAARDVFDTLVRFLRTGLRAVAVLGLVVALGAFLTGPSPAAVRTRGFFTHGIGGVRDSAESHGIQTGRVGVWTGEHTRVLRMLVVLAGGLLLLFWSQPTAGVVIWTAVFVLVAVGLIELVSRPARAADVAPADAPPPVTVPAPREP